MTPFRYLELQSWGGSENMALDQALLESVDAGSRPILRMYAWKEPTLSLGYFQKHADRQSHEESSGARCVRRASGGGAILHDHELTYSIVCPTGTRVGASLDLYHAVHGAIARALEDFGVRAVRHGSTAVHCSKENCPEDSGAPPFLCFQRRTPEDLVVGGYKILGSAQRKGRRAVLQHGSLLLRASELAPQLPGIRDLAGVNSSQMELAGSICEQLARTMSTELRSDSPTPQESERSAEINKNRFATSSWLHRR